MYHLPITPWADVQVVSLVAVRFTAEAVTTATEHLIFGGCTVAYHPRGTMYLLDDWVGAYNTVYGNFCTSLELPLTQEPGTS